MVMDVFMRLYVMLYISTFKIGIRVFKFIDVSSNVTQLGDECFLHCGIRVNLVFACNGYVTRNLGH